MLWKCVVEVEIPYSCSYFIVEVFCSQNDECFFVYNFLFSAVSSHPNADTITSI